jgi:hypothetical protein
LEGSFSFTKSRRIIDTEKIVITAKHLQHLLSLRGFRIESLGLVEAGVSALILRLRR